MGHHYVPQKYLKGFEAAGAPGFIWMFDKLKEVSARVPIDKVAQAPKFYTAEIESELADKVEGPANVVIEKIRRGEKMDEVDKLHLTYYICTMIRRVPRARRKAEEMVPGVLDEVARETRQMLEEAARAGLIDDASLQAKLNEVDAAERKFKQHPPAQVIKTIETPWPFESMLLMIHSMYWRILRSEGPSYFLTSDNPAYFFEGLGLKHTECELTFPLCNDLLLHCSWEPCGDAGIQVAPQSIVKELNRRTASGAERFIFYHEDAPWVFSVAKNKTNQLSRINWD